MQKWEYRIFLRTRGWEEVKGRVYMKATDWNADIVPVLKEFGEEGWELVAVVPYSSVCGGAPNMSWSRDYAGLTTEEMWVFKRPKP